MLSLSYRPGDHWEGFFFVCVRWGQSGSMKCNALCRLTLWIKTGRQSWLCWAFEGLSAFGAWNALWEPSQVSQDPGLSNLSLQTTLILLYFYHLNTSSKFTTQQCSPKSAKSLAAGFKERLLSPWRVFASKWQSSNLSVRAIPRTKVSLNESYLGKLPSFWCYLALPAS